jgi:hypothetical protein
MRGKDVGLGAPAGPAGAGRSTPRTARDDLRLAALASAGLLLALAGAAVMARWLLPGGRPEHLAAGGLTLAAASGAALLALAVLAAPPARGSAGATGRPASPPRRRATGRRRPRR